MKIGIIYCGYNTEEYVKDSISPWIEAKDQYDIRISAVSIPFKEYAGITEEKDSTTDYLLSLREDGKIETVFTEPKYVKEYVARNFCWYDLQASNPDFMIFVDSDEIYTRESITRIFDYVQAHPEYESYQVNFKNYILDGKSWIDFHPFRIYRNDRNGGIRHLYHDGDVMFNNGKIANQTHFTLIPKQVAHIRHMTWLDNEKSKLKVQYHLKHFGACSYRWNEEKKGLEIDYGYYDKHGYDRPIIYND